MSYLYDENGKINPKDSFLSFISKKYGVEITDGQAILPEIMQTHFLGEEKVYIGDDVDSVFFWQRMADFIYKNEDSYFRLNLSPENIPEALTEMMAIGDVIIFWIRIQYEAHILKEEPLCIACGVSNYVKLNPEFMFYLKGDFKPGKIYFKESDLNKRLELMQIGVKEFLQPSIFEIQSTMLKTLKEELHRIHEYYNHLLAKCKKTDEKERLVREKNLLETGHYGKLHPNSLKIIVNPEIIISLTTSLEN